VADMISTLCVFACCDDSLGREHIDHMASATTWPSYYHIDTNIILCGTPEQHLVV
jgi:hypothetical protein